MSSGDPGVYGLAALAFELIEREQRRDWSAVEIAVAPGVSAMHAAAARAGAPLGHDFCAISLSDLLTPWEAIRARLEAAASADFVVALYNPRSARRAGRLAEAAGLLLRHRPPETPCVIARNLGRAGERPRLCGWTGCPGRGRHAQHRAGRQQPHAPGPGRSAARLHTARVF